MIVRCIVCKETKVISERGVVGENPNAELILLSGIDLELSGVAAAVATGYRALENTSHWCVLSCEDRTVIAYTQTHTQCLSSDL